MEVVPAFVRGVVEPVPTVELHVDNLAPVVKLSTESVVAVQVLVIEPHRTGAALCPKHHQIICKAGGGRKEMYKRAWEGNE